MQAGWLSNIGERVVHWLEAQRHLVALVWAVLRVAAEKSTWPRTVVNVFTRQILFTGIEASRFILLLSLMVGILIVVQTQVWLAKVGQSGLLGPVLVMVVVREVGPLLVNFVVIGRSGTAISIELGNMKISGEVRLLDALGLDPFIYLVVPRVLGMAISIFCLTIIFIVGSFVSGYFSGLLLGASVGRPSLFTMSVFRAVQPADVFNLLAKTFIPGLMTGAICCAEGLSVSAAVTEVPQATSRALVRSVGALFVISALVSLLTYM